MSAVPNPETPANNAPVAVPRGRSAPGQQRRRQGGALAAQRQKERKQREMDQIEPKTRIGQLAKHGKLSDVKNIFADSLRPREHFIASKIMACYTEQKLATKSVQKQTRSGQTTKTKITVAIGDKGGMVGVASGRGVDNPAAMQSALAKSAKNLICVRNGYWSEENTTIKPHTIPNKVTGKSGSVRVRLIPAPPGRGLVANRNHTKILELAGIKDIYVKSKGATCTSENSCKALLNALESTYSFYPPSDWNSVNMNRSIADDALILKNTTAVGI